MEIVWWVVSLALTVYIYMIYDILTGLYYYDYYSSLLNYLKAVSYNYKVFLMRFHLYF